MQRRKKALWVCPKCGHGFVTRNLWHSCVRVPLRSHFRGAASSLYPTYRAWAALARALGPVTIYAQKTRIVFQQRVRFASVVVRRSHLDAGLWLRRRVEHPLLIRTEDLGALGYGVHFRLTCVDDLDAGLARLMGEAYRLAREGWGSIGQPRARMPVESSPP
jgi:hypothetical protein